MYESPIEITQTSEFVRQVNDNLDNEIYKAVLKVGVNVSKEELLSALRFDRSQYGKGYEDGYRDAWAEVEEYIQKGKDFEYYENHGMIQ